MQVAKNAVVAIDYTLKDSAGKVLDSSDGREPLRYIHGTGAIISGLEAALEGASTGDRLDVSLAAADAYGERDEALVVEVARAQFDGVVDLAVGMQFRARSAEGDRVFTVTGIAGDQVTVDGNHPLAGQALNFAVEIKDVRVATPKSSITGTCTSCPRPCAARRTAAGQAPDGRPAPPHPLQRRRLISAILSRSTLGRRSSVSSPLGSSSMSVSWVQQSPARSGAASNAEIMSW